MNHLLIDDVEGCYKLHVAIHAFVSNFHGVCLFKIEDKEEKKRQKKKYLFDYKHMITACLINQVRRSLTLQSVRVLLYQDRLRYRQKETCLRFLDHHKSTKTQENKLKCVRTNV